MDGSDKLAAETKEIIDKMAEYAWRTPYFNPEVA
jgi:hypothetical protein